MFQKHVLKQNKTFQIFKWIRQHPKLGLFGTTDWQQQWWDFLKSMLTIWMFPSRARPSLGEHVRQNYCHMEITLSACEFSQGWVFPRYLPAKTKKTFLWSGLWAGAPWNKEISKSTFLQSGSKNPSSFFTRSNKSKEAGIRFPDCNMSAFVFLPNFHLLQQIQATATHTANKVGAGQQTHNSNVQHIRRKKVFLFEKITTVGRIKSCQKTRGEFLMIRVNPLAICWGISVQKEG